MNTSLNLLLATALSLPTCMAQTWHFAAPGAISAAASKNLGPDPLVRLPAAAPGPDLSEAVNLPAGDPQAAIRLFENLAPGYYDVSASVSAPLQSACYLFGKGEGYHLASTMVPAGQNARVVVRGVGTNNGKLLAGLVTDGCQPVQISDLKAAPASEHHFLQGGDITELNYVLDNGGRYADEQGHPLGNEQMSREEMAQGVLNYLAQNGMNFCRIRLTNNPGRPDRSETYYLPDGYQDESDCLQLARMAKEAGLEVQFTFNWSDFWSNGTRQDVPADWLEAVRMAGQGKEAQALAECAYNYTKKVMKNLDALGVHPAYVSLGNETNGGFLFPYAYAYDVPASDATADMPQGYKNWNAIALLVNAGYKAVKEVCPESQVVVHLADNTYDVVDKPDHADWWVYSWYFDELLKAGAKFDVIGASYYPSWSTCTAAEAAKFYNQLIKRYKKDVLVMETGYNWTPKRKDGYDGQLPYTAPAYKERFPFSKEGQRGFLADVLNQFKAVEADGHRVVGDLYWDPMMIHVEDAHGQNATGWANWWQWKTPDANVVENTTLFDFSGQALPAFDAYRFNRNCMPLKAYSITTDPAEGVSFQAAEKAYFGDSVSFEWQPEAGFVVDSLSLTACGKRTVVVADNATRRLTFEMPDGELFCKVYASKTDPSANPLLGNQTAVQAATLAGGVRLTASTNTAASVYTTKGERMHKVNMQAGSSLFLSLPAGIYIIEGKKIEVKD